MRPNAGFSSRRITFWAIGWLSLAVSAVAGRFVFWAQPGEIVLAGDRMTPHQGHCYIAPASAGLWTTAGEDDVGTAYRSEAQLFEDDRPLGPGHSLHLAVAGAGAGRFSHWRNTVYFSASDNSDPRTNGRRYRLVAPVYLSTWVLLVCLFPAVVVFSPWLYARARLLIPSSEKAQLGEARRRFGNIAVCCVVAAAGLWVMGLSSSVLFWIVCMPVVLAAVYLMSNLVRAGLALWGVSPAIHASHPIAFSVASVLVFATLFETVLWLMEQSAAARQGVGAVASAAEGGGARQAADFHLRYFEPEAAAARAGRKGVITLPDRWQLREVDVPGSVQSYYWHDILHVHNEEMFRRTGPFPEKPEGVYRILAVGDSITYGFGVHEKWVYGSVLERALSRDYRVEVFNLGVSGFQSEDILEVVKRHTIVLEADLVFYGVCHNDFLPSGIGQYSGQYIFPLPEAMKAYLLARTRVARFVDQGYDVILRTLDLRKDFYDDILSDFEGYQQRFARDVKRMNAFVLAQGLPPVVTMVFDQVPSLLGRGFVVTRDAETHLKQAGMDVIETESYYRQYDGQKMMVSQWEGHPDEGAHAIFASMIAQHLQGREDLEFFRKR